jgi:hypothetical protein
MRTSVVLLLMLGLCACMPKAATILSAKPFYRSADAARSPTLKPGLWVDAAKTCRFDEASSAGTWPTCAAWMVVRPQTLITRPADFPAEQLETNSYVLVSGSPRVLQLGAPRPHRTWMYDYKGMRPLQLDSRGTITSASLWNVDCVSVLPGSTKTVGAPPDLCSAKSAAVVRAALMTAQDPKSSSGVFHWVRVQEH